MAVAEVDYLNSGGGGNFDIHFKGGSIPAQATSTNITISGKAKYVMYVEDRGYARTNFDPSTMELLSSGTMHTQLAFDETSFVLDTSVSFICTDNNVQISGYISSTNRQIWLIYTLE